MTPLESFRAKLGAYVEAQGSIRSAAVALGISKCPVGGWLKGANQPSGRLLSRISDEIGLTEAEFDALVTMDSDRLARLRNSRTALHPHDAILRRWAR